MSSPQPPGRSLALAFAAVAGNSLGVRAAVDANGLPIPDTTGTDDPTQDPNADPNAEPDALPIAVASAVPNAVPDADLALTDAGPAASGTANLNDPNLLTGAVSSPLAATTTAVAPTTPVVVTFNGPESFPSTPSVPSVILSTPSTPLLSTSSSSLSASASATHPSSAASSDKSVSTITVSRTSAAAESETETAAGKHSKGGSNAGVIAGGVIGALVVIALVIAGVLFYRRRQRLARNNSLLRRLSEHRTNYHPIGSEPPPDGSYDMEAAYDPPVEGGSRGLDPGDDRRMSRRSVIDDESLPSPMPGSGGDSSGAGAGAGKPHAVSMPPSAGLATTGEMLPPLIRVQSHPDTHVPIATVTSSSATPQAVELQHALSISGTAGVTLAGKSAQASADLADLEAARMLQESENRAAQIREKEKEKEKENEAEAAGGGERTGAADPVPPYWMNAGTEEARLDECLLGRAPTYR